MAEAGPAAIDLTDRLRFAAGALASDYGDMISVDHAEALVFRSAERLLAAASVTEFVPILAERLARREMRSAPVARPVAPPEPPAVASIDSIRVEIAAESGRAAVPPMLAVPEQEIAHLRDSVERLRNRLAEWGPTTT